jgi:hypothetical protein
MDHVENSSSFVVDQLLRIRCLAMETCLLSHCPDMALVYPPILVIPFLKGLMLVFFLQTKKKKQLRCLENNNLFVTY